MLSCEINVQSAAKRTRDFFGTIFKGWYAIGAG